MHSVMHSSVLDKSVLQKGALQFRVMGQPSVQLGGQDLPFRTRKALALALYLALEGPQPQDTLLELLWPDAPHGGSLRTAALHLRQALGGEAWRLQTQWCGLSLDLSGASLDAHELSRFSVEQALAWKPGLFLAGLHLKGNPIWDDYLMLRAEALAAEYDQRLSELCRTLTEQGDYDHACELARRRSELDPLSENACSQWAWVLERAGWPQKALSVQAAFVRRFTQAFGSGPLGADLVPQGDSPFLLGSLPSKARREAAVA